MRFGIKSVAGSSFFKIAAALLSLILLATALNFVSSRNKVTAIAPLGSVGIILPDSTSSSRWNDADRQALLTAFSLAGIKVDIENANGNKLNFKIIADQLLLKGAKILVLANLDSKSAAQIQLKAQSNGVPTIDYDRLTSNGAASYFVSFDAFKTGTQQAQALNSCFKNKKITQPNILVLRGPTSDENSTHLKDGYFAILAKQFLDGTSNLLASQEVPDWNPKYVSKIVSSALKSTNLPLDGIVAGNDGIAIAAINEFKRLNLPLPACITSQDATDEALGKILSGEIYASIFKDARIEAQSTALLALDLLTNTPPQGINSLVDNGLRKIPSITLQPSVVMAAQIPNLIIGGYTTKGRICDHATPSACAKLQVN